MKVGWIGTGKLGLPCAVAAADKGHDVMGYDLDPARMSKEPQPYLETGPDGVEPFNPYLAESPIRFGSLQDVCNHAEILFVAVQTPHDPRFEGVTPIPHDRKDFDYSYLRSSIRHLSEVIKKPTYVVIVSTVLPGTIRREILPLANKDMEICYNPFFIAMGTTWRDFLNPEFVLFGVDGSEPSERARKAAKEFYKPITDAPILDTTIENAELIKVGYNLFISQKIAYANTMMEICDKIPGCDVDVFSEAIKLSTERLLSPMYTRGGLGDGGGCHPRDGIAMSWLAKKLDLSHDLFRDVMVARDDHSLYLARLVRMFRTGNRPVVLMGTAFKKGTNLEVGSPALLLAHQLEWQARSRLLFAYDPWVDKDNLMKITPNDGLKVNKERFCPVQTFQDWQNSPVCVITCNHDDWLTFDFPENSTIIDPWRMLVDREFEESITYYPVGRTPLSD